MIINRFLASLIIVIGLVVSCRAKDWRGIVPLHSMRSDVEKLLGPPEQDLEGILVSHFVQRSHDLIILNRRRA